MDFSFNTEDILLSFYRQAINFNTVFSEPLINPELRGGVGVIGGLYQTGLTNWNLFENAEV